MIHRYEFHFQPISVELVHWSFSVIVFDVESFVSIERNIRPNELNPNHEDILWSKSSMKINLNFERKFFTSSGSAASVKSVSIWNIWAQKKMNFYLYWKPSWKKKRIIAGMTEIHTHTVRSEEKRKQNKQIPIPKWSKDKIVFVVPFPSKKSKFTEKKPNDRRWLDTEKRSIDEKSLFN